MLVLILKIYNATVNLFRMEAQAHKITQELLYSRVIQGPRRVASVDTYYCTDMDIKLQDVVTDWDVIRVEIHHIIQESCICL